VVGVAAASAISFKSASAKQEASPEAGAPGLPPIPAGAVVVAEGLWNPQDLAFGDDGTLYIVEQGVAGGGTEEPAAATPNADGSLPAAALPVLPGQISKVGPDGALSVVAAGFGGEVGISFQAGKLYVSRGGGSVGSGLAPNAFENTVSVVDLASGTLTELASLGQYEVDNNPDGTDVNPNLYGNAIDADGLLYQADAGGNTIYTINTTTGEFALFTVIPNLESLTMASPVPVEQSRQPVPTGIVIDADGLIHVSLLSEGWSGPSLLTYTPDGAYTAGPGPLATVVNIAQGPDGLIYASQLSDNLMLEQPALGSIKRITADGAVETVVEGLFFPHGIAFDAAGAIYIAVNSIISGPDAPLGKVIKLDGIA
ncbi:MAG: ScyD/ScyE family protein, partial [Thermomicrobiales bacterium]